MLFGGIRREQIFTTSISMRVIALSPFENGETDLMKTFTV